MSAEEQAAAVRQQFDSTAARIRASSSLTRDGKLQQLARAHAAAKEALAQLQQDAQAQAVADRQTWSRQAFAVDAAGPHSAVSARDAFARAATVTDPADAAKLLRQAEQSGDEVLARAVAHHAHDNAWDDVVTTYAANRPAAAGAIGNLASTAGSPSIRDRFIEAGTFYLPHAQRTRAASRLVSSHDLPATGRRRHEHFDRRPTRRSPSTPAPPMRVKVTNTRHDAARSRCRRWRTR